MPTDLQRMMERHHVPFADSGNHHCRPGWIQFHCPFCPQGSSGFHLGFNLKNGGFSCWKCGGKKFWDVVPVLLRMSLPEARLAAREFRTEGLVTYIARTKPKPAERPRHLAPPGDAGPLRAPHRRYLEGRGFDSRELETSWGLLATGRHGGPWAWRVLLPVRNAASRIVAYQGRAIGEREPRYKMTLDEECLEDPRTFLYGIEKTDGDSAMVVEGGPGAWRLGPGAVATLGIGWKQEQLNILRRFKNLFIIFDPEPQAQRRAQSLARGLALFKTHVEVVEGFETDPGEFKPRLVRKIRRELGFPEL